jgi:hypothetical protein
MANATGNTTQNGHLRDEATGPQLSATEGLAGETTKARSPTEHRLPSTPSTR